MDELDILKLLEEEERLKREFYYIENNGSGGKDGMDGKNADTGGISGIFYNTDENNYFTENVNSVTDGGIDGYFYSIYNAGKSVFNETENNDIKNTEEIFKEIQEQRNIKALIGEGEKNGNTVMPPIDISLNIDIENRPGEMNIERILSAVTDRLREELSAAAAGSYL